MPNLKSQQLYEQSRQNLLNAKKNGFSHAQGKPEVQVHCAATIIELGDPYALVKENRQDKPVEIGQFAVRFPKNSYGSMTRSDVTNAMNQFHQALLKRLREWGAMKAGE